MQQYSNVIYRLAFFLKPWKKIQRCALKCLRFYNGFFFESKLCIFLIKLNVQIEKCQYYRVHVACCSKWIKTTQRREIKRWCNQRIDVSIGIAITYNYHNGLIWLLKFFWGSQITRLVICFSWANFRTLRASMSKRYPWIHAKPQWAFLSLVQAMVRVADNGIRCAVQRHKLIKECNTFLKMY